MIMRFMVWIFTRFTAYDPDLLEWACRQEEAAKRSTNFIEDDLRMRQRRDRHEHA